MKVALLKESHEDKFLQQGWLLALSFSDGWICFRVQDKEWTKLAPWSLGPVTAGGTLAKYDEVQDSNSRHYLAPYDQALIYHTFWGLTPNAARVKVQYPPRKAIGDILSIDRSDTDDTGYIPGDESPYNGPFADNTELFTVFGLYPAFNVYNPTASDFYNVMMKFDQRHYTYQIISDPELIKSMLTGERRVKKYTMGPAFPSPISTPQWLKDTVNKLPAVTYNGKQVTLLQYSTLSMGGTIK